MAPTSADESGEPEDEPRRKAGTRFRDLVPIALVIAVATWAAYAQVTAFAFVGLDDDDYVLANANVLGGLNAAGVRWAWTTGAVANWHPLTWMSHMLDVELFGLDAGAHHGTNLALHVLAALLLFGAIRSACRSTGVALLTSLLFALHPLHVESVAWVSERKDVLSTVFGFGALWAYAAYARKGGAVRYVLVLLLLACSLCSKATFVTLPFVLLLLDYWPLGRVRGGPPPAFAAQDGAQAPARTLGFGRLALEKLPMLVLAAASSTVTYLVQAASGATELGQVVPLADRAANAVVVYAVYLAKTFVPLGMAVYYPHPSLGDGRSAAAVAGAALLLVALTVALWSVRRRRPYLLVGWLWYLGTLVPMIGLVQVGTQAMADRYTYVPMVGILLALSFGLVELVRARPNLSTPLVAAAVLACLGCGLLTRRQAATWRDTGALARHALEVAQPSQVAYTMLGDWHRENGRPAEALEEYSRALALGTETVPLLNNVGVCLFEQGQVDQAIERYRRALELAPDGLAAHLNLARALTEKDLLDEATEHYLFVLSVDPDSIDANNNFGIVLSRQRRFADAEPHFLAVLRLSRSQQQSFETNINLGSCYANLWQSRQQAGDLAGAEKHRQSAADRYRAARALDPSSELPAQLLAQIGFDR